MPFGMSINCQIKASLNERSPIDNLWHIADIPIVPAFVYWTKADNGGFKLPTAVR
jgi:hypothetical protein